jgi:hypothetical protein
MRQVPTDLILIFILILVLHPPILPSSIFPHPHTNTPTRQHTTPPSPPHHHHHHPLRRLKRRLASPRLASPLCRRPSPVARCPLPLPAEAAHAPPRGYRPTIAITTRARRQLFTSFRCNQSLPPSPHCHDLPPALPIPLPLPLPSSASVPAYIVPSSTTCRVAFSPQTPGQAFKRSLHNHHPITNTNTISPCPISTLDSSATPHMMLHVTCQHTPPPLRVLV